MLSEHASPSPSSAPAVVAPPAESAARPRRRPRRKARGQGRQGAVARHYEAIIERAPDATVVTDHEGCIRLVNRQTEVLFGYRRKELLGQPIERLIPERFHHAHQQHRAGYAAAPRTRPMGAALQLFGRRRDGSEFPVEVSLAPLRDDEEEAGETGEPSLVIASIRDVSELQRVHAARREAEQANEDLRRLQALTDTALAHLELDDLLPELLDRMRDVMDVDNATVLLLDPDGQTLRIWAARGLEAEVAAGVRVPVGQGFAGRIAASREPLIVEDLSTFPVVSPFLRERLRSAVGVPLIRGERLLGVLHIGTVAPHHFTARDVQLVERAAERIAVAIERAHLFESEQQARHEAERQAEQLERIFETITDGLSVYDAQGHLVQTNEAQRRIFGLDAAPPEYYQRPLPDHVAPYQVRDQQGQPLAPEDWPVTRALQGETVTGAQALDFRLRALDGREVDVTASAAPLRDPAGHIVGAVGIVRDQTERNRLAREREAAQASELAVREVNRHLDDFFRTAAHDVRQPITVAKGHADLAVRRLERLLARAQARGSKQAEQLARVLATVWQTGEKLDQLAQLSTQLFDVARARTGTLELQLSTLDLAALVQEQVAAQRNATPARAIDLSLPDGGQPVWVRGDGVRLQQVLTNYLTNAVKYSAADKPVEVRMEVAEQLAVVSVRDEGPGLPWEEQSQVWEMLYRSPGVEVHSGQEGSLGLGLYIVKRLMELHPGGRVGVESVVGEGSTFWFRLPLAS